ncbi:MAG: type II CAAX prenyl endopeptidase Rce1 family protein [Mycobacterium leprae]
MKRLATRSPLLTYFVLAFAISWIGWVPIAALHLKLGSPVVVLAPFACGPTIAGIVVSGLLEGRKGISALLRRLGAWRVGLRWYIFILLNPITLLLAGVLLRSLVQQQPVNWASAPAAAYSGAAVIGIALAALVAGLLGGPLNEELGWRGFALPHLQERYSPFGSSLLLGLVWSLWHLPLFYVVGMSQYGHPLLPFVASVTLTTFFLTWVNNRTGGSLLMAVLFHDFYNAVPSFFPAMPWDWWVIAVTTVAVVVMIGLNRAEWFQVGSGQRQPLSQAS